MNLWKKIKLKLGAALIRQVFELRRTNIDFHELSKKRASNPQYKINDFKDVLFNTDGQKREDQVILKIFKSHFDYLAFLCSCSYRWIAVKIPLDICGGETKGDIDILISTIRHTTSPDGDLVKDEVIYRAFEVKTTKIYGNQTVKALRQSDGQVREIKSQVEKLISSGSQQTFLLEAFILEAGYSSQFEQIPKNVLSFIKQKVKGFRKEKFGYVCLFLEQQKDFDEDMVVIPHQQMQVKRANIEKLKSPIKEITDKINSFFDNNHKPGGPDVMFISYCSKCKDLRFLSASGPYKCDKCGKEIFS